MQDGIFVEASISPSSAGPSGTEAVKKTHAVPKDKDPVWDCDFIMQPISAKTAAIVFTIKEERKKKAIGHVTLPLLSLENQEMQEKELPIELDSSYSHRKRIPKLVVRLLFSFSQVRKVQVEQLHLEEQRGRAMLELNRLAAAGVTTKRD